MAQDAPDHRRVFDERNKLEPRAIAVMPDGTFGRYISGARSPLRFSMSVAAGQTLEIRIAAIGTARDFELTTAAR